MNEIAFAYFPAYSKIQNAPGGNGHDLLNTLERLFGSNIIRRVSAIRRR